MIDFINLNGKIIIIGSTAGKLKIIKKQDLMNQFTD